MSMTRDNKTKNSSPAEAGEEFRKLELLVDGDDNTGTNGTAAFTDSEAQADLDRDRGDQLDVHVDVIAGHAHLNTLGEADDAGHVGGTEVELGTVVVEERGVTAALFLGQDVNLALELGVGVDGLRFRASRQAETLSGDLLRTARFFPFSSLSCL